MTLHERDIEDYLVTRVKQRGGTVRKVKWIGRRGAPDRFVIIPQRVGTGGWSVWVELKAPGRKPTAGQLAEHRELECMGQRVEVIDSIEGVDRLLK